MKRLKRLYKLGKIMLIVMALMIPVFAFIYSKVTAREGLLYRNAILVPAQENGQTVYAGKIKGQDVSFTVTADRTVTFRNGDITVGPYVVKEDPRAVPESSEIRTSLYGAELRLNDRVLFRGGVLKELDTVVLYKEDGSVFVDSDEPSAAEILNVALGPALTHKGNWVMWFAGTIACVINAVYILYADEIFRWQLRFRIRDTEEVDPTDWEITCRYIGWIASVVLAAAVYLFGLR